MIELTIGKGERDESKRRMTEGEMRGVGTAHLFCAKSHNM